MAPIKVRKTGLPKWPWIIWCEFCKEDDSLNGINSPLGWKTWNMAFSFAFRHSFTHKKEANNGIISEVE